MYNVKGSLKRHAQWWHTNIKNDYIVSVIDHGYKLPLLDIPEPIILRNNKSSLDNEQFVTDEIEKLLESGVGRQLKQIPTVVNALTVAVNVEGKKRLVLDLRTVNPLLDVPKIKYEDIRTASLYFKRNAFMSVFDLKSGYHHVDVHEAYQQYTGFAWKNKYYCYASCPFGLSVAGAIFSKILKELVKIWRTKGIAVVLYLDDGIIVGNTENELEDAVNTIRQDLFNSGFVVNEEKSVWVPAKQVKWLGFLIDSDKNQFSVPTSKLHRLKEQIKGNLMYQHACSARKIAKTTGVICSLYPAYGPIVYMLTKNCSLWIEQRLSWDDKSELPQAVYSYVHTKTISRVRHSSRICSCGMNTLSRRRWRV